MRASSLPLLMKCAGSLVLPHIEFRTPEQIEKSEESTSWGTMVHHWKETGEVVHANTRTANAFRKAILLSGANRDLLWPGGRHEVAISLAVDGTRRVESGDQRAGEKGWLTCHIDWVSEPAVDEHGLGIRVSDLKTGKKYADDPDGNPVFPQNPTSEQLLGYGLAALALQREGCTGEARCGGVWLSIDHWPRLPLAERHKLPTVLGPEFASWEQLEVFWSELESTERTADSPDLVPGDHCRFCPSKLACIVAQPDPPPFQWRR